VAGDAAARQIATTARTFCFCVVRLTAATPLPAATRRDDAPVSAALLTDNAPALAALRSDAAYLLSSTAARPSPAGSAREPSRTVVGRVGLRWHGHPDWLGCRHDAAPMTTSGMWLSGQRHWRIDRLQRIVRIACWTAAGRIGSRASRTDSLPLATCRVASNGRTWPCVRRSNVLSDLLIDPGCQPRRSSCGEGLMLR
jgi:hypothetical protein